MAGQRLNPLGELVCLLRPVAAMGGLLLSGGSEGEGGKGLTYKGSEEMGGA